MPLLEENNPALLQKGKNRKAILALSVVCFLWGTTWVASRQGVKHMPALQMAGMRQALAGIVYTGYFLTRKMKWPSGREWLNIIILSLLNFGITNGLTTWGVQYISGGLGAIIAAIFPLWLLLFDLVGYRNPVSGKALAGMLLGFLGVCIIFYEHLSDFLNPQFRFGIIISLVGSLSWALGTLFTKQQAKTFDPYFSLGLQMLFSGLLLFSISSVSGMSIPLHSIPWQSWAAIAYLLVFGSVIGFITYLYALQRLPTEEVSIYGYINPIVAVLVGAFIFQEKLTIYIGIGGAVTLYGVYLVNQGFKDSD